MALHPRYQSRRAATTPVQQVRHHLQARQGTIVQVSCGGLGIAGKIMGRRS